MASHIFGQTMTESQEKNLNDLLNLGQHLANLIKFVVGKPKRHRTMIVSIKTQVHHKFQNMSLNL